MENRNGIFRQGSGVWRALRDGDFEEEDVWSVMKERTDSSTKMSRSKESSLSVPRHIPTAARMIPKTSGEGFESSSSSVNSSHEVRIIQQSAPVNIPNWPNTYRHKSKKASRNASWYDDDHYHDADGDGDDDDDGIAKDGRDSEDEEEDDDNDYGDGYDYKVPPHEFIARRLARSQISSFSVFEGVGRTLKGRDLSKVRNAVLTKTGFIE
ncbi:Senescence regulator [Trema orientale]|uniref:Senescence regulator n=1 Tax=Trema orientale TaxID=63057 RepID=A0A2P5F2E5_TREOI|nr:Senescence regulator [Trema orientale]